jgi:DNA topoisomerase-2
MIRQRTTTEFFKNDKPSWAVYDALRKLPNFIDGFKISQRKLMWIAFNKLQKEWMKTETFCNIVALDTAYIHGSGNLCGVCASLVQDFIGACNYQYLMGNDGGWGSRLITRESAPRYTKLKLAEISKKLFNPIDNEIFEKQFFEGQYIEPKYLIPVFPTLFLNSSNGITAGFSSNIYSRNPNDIISYIKKKLAGTEHPRMDLPPWFRGYKGTIRYNDETKQYESVGNIVQNNMTSYTIDEIPVETSYQKYVEMLDKLEEDKVIVDYEDKCDPRTNAMLFEIRTTREFTRKHEDIESLYKTFKLVKSLPENLNCIDQDNRVKEFSSVQEILDSFISIRLKFYQKRKDYIIEDLKNKLTKLASQYYFIKGIVDGTIIVNKRKKDNIVAQLEKIDKIKKIDGSFDYLLAMNISSLTIERMEELKKKIEEGKEEYRKTKETSIQDMWIADLNELKKCL